MSIEISHPTPREIAEMQSSANFFLSKFLMPAIENGSITTGDQIPNLFISFKETQNLQITGDLPDVFRVAYELDCLWHMRIKNPHAPYTPHSRWETAKKLLNDLLTNTQAA